MQVFERYADFVVYDRINCINTVVAEVKQDEMETAETQHNEQMVGLWSVGQITMFGLEFKSTSVVPKILAADNNALCMFYLNPLNLANMQRSCWASLQATMFSQTPSCDSLATDLESGS